MEIKKAVNIGAQRFDRIIEENKFYIDKTEFIRECFFSNKYADRGDLFEGLSIFADDSDREKYRTLQGTFPVIFMTFAPIKTGNIEEMKTVVKQIRKFRFTYTE